MGISNDQLTRDRNTCNTPFYFVPSSLAVQCPEIRRRRLHSPGDRYNNDSDCPMRLCLPLHPQRPVCLASKYYLYNSALQTQSPFERTLDGSLLQLEECHRPCKQLRDCDL